jgi:hypothetical protein
LIASWAACRGTAEVWDGNMNVAKDAMLLRILFGEEDRFEGSPLYEAIVQKATRPTRPLLMEGLVLTQRRA